MSDHFKREIQNQIHDSLIEDFQSSDFKKTEHLFEIITANMESHSSESLVNSDLISMMIFIKL